MTFTERTKPPLVPVMVSVRVRLCTFRSVSIVSTEVPEFTIDVGFNVAVARGGTPLTDRPTVPVNPCPAAIVTVYVATPSLAIVWLAGVAEMEKSPLTTSVTFTVRVSGPLVPWIVSGYVPDAVAALVATLIVVDPDVVTDAGANAAVAPAGRPVTLKATVPVNPAPGVTVAENVVLPPDATVRDTGVAESVKSATVIVRVAG